MGQRQCAVLLHFDEGFAILQIRREYNCYMIPYMLQNGVLQHVTVTIAAWTVHYLEYRTHSQNYYPS